MTDDPAAYPWSSCAGLCGLRQDPLLTPHPVQQAIGADRYRALLSEAISEEDLAAIRGDLEWLAGERMIEEAIALARTGTASEEIATETGLSADAIRTISAFRHH